MGDKVEECKEAIRELEKFCQTQNKRYVYDAYIRLEKILQSNITRSNSEPTIDKKYELIFKTNCAEIHLR